MIRKKIEHRANRTAPIGNLIDSVLEKYKLSDGIFLSKLMAEKKIIFGEYAYNIKNIRFFQSCTGANLTETWKHIKLSPNARMKNVLVLEFIDGTIRSKAYEEQNRFLELLEKFAPGKVQRIFFA